MSFHCLNTIQLELGDSESEREEKVSVDWDKKRIGLLNGILVPETSHQFHQPGLLRLF